MGRIFSFAAVLAFGFLAGWCVQALTRPSSPVPVEDKVPVKARAKPLDVGRVGAEAALRRRIRELERRLADLSSATNPPSVPAPAAREEPREAGLNRFRNRLAELKKNDPARYAQMTNDMAQGRRRMAAHFNDRLSFLSSLDVSVMTDKQRADHDRLQELLTQREELMRQMRPLDESVTEEQRREAFGKMRQLHEQIRSLERSEREMLLTQTANNLGFDGDDAREIVSTIKRIYEVTESRGPGGPGGRPPHFRNGR